VAKLVQCPDCHNEMSPRAKCCPRCGWRPPLGQRLVNRGTALIVIVIATLVFLALASWKISTDAIRQHDEQKRSDDSGRDYKRILDGEK